MIYIYIYIYIFSLYISILSCKKGSLTFFYISSHYLKYLILPNISNNLINLIFINFS